MFYFTHFTKPKRMGFDIVDLLTHGDGMVFNMNYQFFLSIWNLYLFVWGSIFTHLYLILSVFPIILQMLRQNSGYCFKFEDNKRCHSVFLKFSLVYFNVSCSVCLKIFFVIHLVDIPGMVDVQKNSDTVIKNVFHKTTWHVNIIA